MGNKYSRGIENRGLGGSIAAKTYGGVRPRLDDCFGLVLLFKK